MRSPLVLVLLPALLFQGCASAPSPRPADPRRAAAPIDFPAINEELEGDSATVELAGGEVVRRAESVVLAPQTTSWRDAKGVERSVPTAEVLRVLHDPRHLAGRAFGYGVLAALLPAYLVAQNSTRHNGDPFAGFGYFAVGLPAGGLLGMAIAISHRHPVVVYAAPTPPSQAEAALQGVVHCHLAGLSVGGRFDCSAP